MGENTRISPTAPKIPFDMLKFYRNISFNVRW